jgi:hypothetical protein
MNEQNYYLDRKPICQHTFGAIANFAVNSRLRFERNFIFERKYRFRSSQPRQATNVGGNFAEPQKQL